MVIRLYGSPCILVCTPLLGFIASNTFERSVHGYVVQNDELHPQPIYVGLRNERKILYLQTQSFHQSSI